MNNNSKVYAAAIRLIESLDVAFGGRSQWGPEQLALAVVGNIANQGFPEEEWYAPIEVLAHEEDELPDGWDIRFSAAFHAEKRRRAQRRFANAKV
jgi:hypothetical protein